MGQGWSKKRNQFQKMLNDAKLGRFDTIVCWKSDRLSRGMYPAAALMEVVEASHVNLEAVMDSIDMKTFGLMAAIGKIELDNFRERSSMGKRGTAKAGRIPVSNVPYGYRVGEGGRPEIVEEEAEVVRRIYRWCVDEGLGATVIRNRLTAEGAPLGRAGKRWWDGQIHRLLTNETYKGTWWYGHARYVSTEDGIKVYDQDPENWIGVPFPAIIDEETWDRCQEMRTKRKTYSGRNTKIFYLLQHLVRCTECGMLMGCMATRKRTVKHGDKVYKYDLEVPRRYYKCYGVQHFQDRLPGAHHDPGGAAGGVSLGTGQERAGQSRPHRGGYRVPGGEGRGWAERGGNRQGGAGVGESAVRGGPGHPALRVGEDNRGPVGPPAEVHHGKVGERPQEAGRLPGQGVGPGGAKWSWPSGCWSGRNG